MSLYDMVIPVILSTHTNYSFQNETSETISAYVPLSKELSPQNRPVYIDNKEYLNLIKFLQMIVLFFPLFVHIWIKIISLDLFVNIKKCLIQNRHWR